MFVITIANTKGGTAKTTCVKTLAYELSKRHRVLMIDLDPQHSLTDSCLLEINSPTLADTLKTTGKSHLASAIRPLKDNLAILPSDQRLTTLERELQSSVGAQFVLDKALKAITGFDLALIDTPPTLSQLVISALVAGDGLIVPLRPEANDIRACKSFMELVSEVQELPTVRLKLIGFLPQMVNMRATIHTDGLEAIKALLGEPVLDPIGSTVRVSEATANNQSITEFEPDNPRSLEYQNLAKEVEKWLKRIQ